MAETKRKSRGDTPEAESSHKLRSKPSAEAKVDPTYGQRSAIPGLDNETLQYSDEEFDYDEDMDALAYLRAVRQEATTIPNLLVAPKTPISSDNRKIYGDCVGEFRGWYADGAYIAQSDPISTDAEEDKAVEEDADPRLVYFDTILARYQTLRDQLSQTPPRLVVEQLGRDHPTHVDKMNRDLTRFWIKKMRSVDPKAAQLACFDKGSVLRLLRLLTQGTLLKRGLGVEASISMWIWSLLAKLPERGELSSEEIGVVRELGKKAVLVGMGLVRNKEWEEGIKEVEKGFDRDARSAGDLEGEDKDVTAYDEKDVVVNEEEIMLEEELQDDRAEAESREGAGGNQEATANEPSKSASSEPACMKTEASNHTTPALDPLATAKARLLANITAKALEAPEAHASGIELGFEPNPEPTIGPVQPEKPTFPENDFDARINTKATVDVILTVAGEAYGQRDLLEFRGQWGGN
ncbi:uncharacterized protein RAG0_02436 [Rhynchosporium agropyri]|uniref:Uncharacterized protein n=1 Tax=Rhynchosporium agropyri TaxID=914238 RepID=A0A1E1K1E2_9HELO|nr:uncharacterized protein RAG0_02436 [Rhynchosporium agropyri]